MPRWWNGIHVGLKIQWEQSREGSSPSLGTRLLSERSELSKLGCNKQKLAFCYAKRTSVATNCHQIMYLKIRIDNSKKLNIRGIFADETIAKGELVEICPVILFPDSELEHISKTVLTKYEFCWDDNNEAIVLGYGSLYNHSFEPNVEFEHDFTNNTMRYTALRDIEKDEELYIDYMQGAYDEPIPEEYLDHKN